jgi:RNA polymerase sigma-70 factor (ECF subfamily)
VTERKQGAITELLNDPLATDGGRAISADRLWELIYPELRKRAKALYLRERADQTLSPTAIINETYVRLASLSPREWKDRSHFYAVSSGIMRNVLIDHARAKTAAKRGGRSIKQSLDESLFPSTDADEAGYQAAREALEHLAVKHERAALGVALRVFGGLTVAEVARELAVSERTVKSDFVIARVKLRELLAPDSAPGPGA